MKRMVPNGAWKSLPLLCLLSGACAVIALVATMSCQKVTGGSSGLYTIKFDPGNAAPPPQGKTYAVPKYWIAKAGEKYALPARYYGVTPGADEVALPVDASATGSTPGAYFLGWTKTAKPEWENTVYEPIRRLTKEAGGSPGEAITVNSDMTLYAVYVTISAYGSVSVRKVVLNKNSGGDTFVRYWPDDYSSLVATGQKIAPYSESPIVRPEYNFTGWSTKLDSPDSNPPFVATKYQPGILFELGAPVDGNYMVYANWQEIATKVKLIFHKNGAAAGTDPIVGTIYGAGQPMIVYGLSSINDYAAVDWVNGTKTLRGWAKTAEGPVVYEPWTTITSDTDLDLYAVWSDS